MRGRAATIAATALLAFGMAGPAEAKTETWYHSGSQLTWQSLLGWRQVIRYQEPRPGLGDARIGPGTVLFTGWRYGRKLYGRVRTFREGCPGPFHYRVRGMVTTDGTRAILQGLSPVVEGCRIVDWRAFGPDTILVLVKAL